MINKIKSGIAIAIAWPETLCKQPGSWYDLPMQWMGINRGNYYKVGHAALVLIEKRTGRCHYFDFGRYHAPARYGRVRSAETDHDLEISITAKFGENGHFENYSEILQELYKNESCHGSGRLHAGYCPIDFESAHKTAFAMQAASPIKYGPFLPLGTNCSRFVNKVILAGKPDFLKRLLLFSPRTFSPTPIENVNSLDYHAVIGDCVQTIDLNKNIKSARNEVKAA